MTQRQARKTRSLTVLGGLLMTVALTPFSPPRKVAAEGGFVLESQAVYHASYGDQWVPDLAFGAGVYFSAWTDLRTGGAAGGGYDLYAQAVNPDGTLVFAGSLVLLRDFDLIVGYPRVAWNGSSFLVVWHENDWGASPGAIKALRVAPDGAVLDAEPITIATGTGGLTLGEYDAEGDGDGFLVLYDAGGGGVSRIDGKRVSANGMVMDETPISIRPGAGGPALLVQPRVVFGAGTYMVTWSENERIRAARVRTDGTVLDPGGALLTGFPSAFPNLATDGSKFLLVWAEADDPPALNAGGGVLDPDTMAIETFHNLTNPLVDGSAWPGQLAYDGARYLVTIYKPEPSSAFNKDLHGIFVDATGAPAGPVFPIEIRQLADQGPGGVAFDGNRYFAVWEDNRDGSAGGYSIYGKFIPPDGGPVSLNVTLVSPGASWQLISSSAFDGTNFLVIWEDWRNGPLTGYKAELYASRVTPDGQVLDDPAFLVVDDPNREEEPQMVFGGGQYFVVFQQTQPFGDVVRGVRIAQDGTVLDPGGFLIAEPLANGDLIRPHVGFNGSYYLVVWHNNYGQANQVGVVGKVVDLDGEILSPSVIPIATQSFVGDTTFDVASNGDEFLVTTTVYNGAGGDLVRATRVSTSGQVLGATTLANSSFSVQHTSIAFNGERYLAVWQTGQTFGVILQGRYLTADGQPEGGQFDITTGTHGYLDVSAHGGTFVIPFIRDTANPPGWYMTQLDGAGSVLVDDELLYAAPFDEFYSGASIAGDGRGTMLFCPTLWADMPFNAPRVWAYPFALSAGEVPGDVDGDGDVDLVDFSIYVGCVTGPGAAGLPGACDVFDFDSDEDVDRSDFAVFQIVYAH